MANMAQAIRMALHYAEEHLSLKDVFGQDTGPPLGGVFTVSQGLKTAWNSPLDERGIIGTAIGIALTGERCVAEIQFADYIFNSIDLLKLAGQTSWASNGQYNMPLVVMTPSGAGIHGAVYHSHSFESWAVRLPGWKVVMPSDSLSAYGLMLSAVKDPNPVLYLKPKALLRVKGEKLIPGEPGDEKQLKQMIDKPVNKENKNWRAEWPKLKEYLVSIGQGRVIQSGGKLTLVSFGRSLYLCKKALSALEAEGRQVELIDMQSLYPYDWPLIKKSILKTKKVLFVNEDTEVAGFTEHLAHRAVQECFYELYAPPKILAGKQVPGVGLHPNLEKAAVPQVENIVQALKDLFKEKP